MAHDEVAAVLAGERAWAVMQGDCLEAMSRLPDSSIDVILTDPPYFLPAQHYSARTAWPRTLADLSIIEHFMRSVVSECRRIAKPTGAVFMFCDGQSYPVMYSVSYRLFDRLTDIVWDKGVIGMGQGVRRQHELILVALPNGFAWQDWTRSVIKHPPVGNDERVHPAQKPVGLMRQLLRLVGKPGAVVLDPFMGSASSGTAALQERMRYIGCDGEPAYIERAKHHLACIGDDHTGASLATFAPLFAATEALP